jgi:hypothetical protein
MRFFFQSVLYLALISGMVGCRGETGTQTTPVLTGSPAGTEPTAAPADPTQTGLAGIVFYASDVTGRPDEPLPDQLVLAVPVEKASELLEPGSEQLADRELRFLKASLSAAHPEIHTTLSDSAGSYTLLLAPGEYLLCLADSEANPPGFPAVTRGCGRAQVQPGELTNVDISSGFGEILLVVP